MSDKLNPEVSGSGEEITPNKDMESGNAKDVQFPGAGNENISAEVDQNETTPEDEESMLIGNPDDPLGEEFDAKSYESMMRQMADMIKIMEQSWNSTRDEFKLSDSHLKMLYQFNEENRVPMPDNLTDEQKNEWDHFNGLDKLTDEDIINVFGNDHPIIGVHHDQTVDRIKDSVNEFFAYLSALREYRQVNDAYLMLVDQEEEKEIAKLKVMMEEETDPEKKVMMKESIDLYYDRKYIRFIAEADEKTVEALTHAFSDEKKITYWLNRGQDKLAQLKISSKFILEISQFEKRFLPEKYHKLSNMVLLYTLRSLIYTDCTDKNKSNHERNKIICIIMALDKIVQGRCTEEVKNIILENICEFLDKFIDKVDYETSVNAKYEKMEENDAAGNAEAKSESTTEETNVEDHE